ncbi:MAG: hypothetical protein AB7T37_02015, partial [Dehalococcoidia bacterium]
MQPSRRFVAPSLLLAALLIAACGGDDDDSSTATPAAGASASASGTSAAGTTASGSPAASPAGSSTASSSATAPTGSPAPSPSASPASTADASAAFRDLTQDRSEEKIAVSYNLTLVDDGETRTGTWRIVQDPPRSLVFFTFDGSNGGKFWVIDDGESSIICFDTDDEPGQCLKTGDSSLSDSLIPSVVDVDETFDAVDDAPDVREVAGRTIAGRAARCFEYD